MATDPKITIEAAYEVFENPGAIASIPVKSQGFVKSLLAGKAKYGTNSIKQQHWIRVYAEKALEVGYALGGTPHAKPFGVTVTTDGVAKAISDVIVGTALQDMLKTAEDFVFSNGGKKRPQIKFSKSPDTPRVAFKLASLASKYKGSVMVTSGGAYNQSHFFGHIHEGIFTPAPKCTDEITKFVVKFATNPHKMGSAYGLATMHCCFCSRPIDTVESKTMGYGPVCANKFGLPWGAKATKAAIGATSSVKKWIALDDQVSEMGKLAVQTGQPLHITGKGGVSGFAKVVAATGISEPFEDEPLVVDDEPFVDEPTTLGDMLDKVTPAPEVAQDFGFTCGVCMDTGKDLTPEGMLVDCGGCK